MNTIQTPALRRISFLALGTVTLQIMLVAAGYYLLQRSNFTTMPAGSAIRGAGAASSDSSKLHTGVQEASPLYLEQDIDSQQRSALPSNTAPSKAATTSDNTSTTKNYEVLRGDTISRIWTKNGDTITNALKAAKALQAVPDGGLKTGDQIQLQIAATGLIQTLRKKTKAGRVLVLTKGLDGEFTTSFIEPEFVDSERTVSGVIKSSFSSAAREDGVPFEVIDDLVDLFGPRVIFHRDLHPGDTYTIIYAERRTPQGELLSSGSIRAASIENQGTLLAAVRHSQVGTADTYYDELGNPVGGYFLRYPLQFSRISSVFTDNRLHPVLGQRRAHNGVDYAAPIGTPVRSVADGVVVVAGSRGGAGNMVRIIHGDRWTTEYFHLSAIKSSVRNGARVSRGQVIGSVGTTGLSSGPHLHFGLFDRGSYVDPLRTKLPSVAPVGEKIPKDYLVATLLTLRSAHEQSTLMAAARLAPEPKV